jgi:hypothetical protein
MDNGVVGNLLLRAASGKLQFFMQSLITHQYHLHPLETQKLRLPVSTKTQSLRHLRILWLVFAPSLDRKGPFKMRFSLLPLL